MEKSSGLSIASLVAALVAGPDEVPDFAFSAADWESFGHEDHAGSDGENLGQNVDDAGNMPGDRDVT